MATVLHLFIESVSIAQDIISESECLQIPIRIRHFAALKIQKVFRGYRVRKEIKAKSKYATIIQKHVRGWLTRWHLPYYMQLHLYDVRHHFVHKMATKIQATWKGYNVRKHMKSSIRDRVKAREEFIKVNEDRMMEIRQLFEAHEDPISALGLEEKRELEAESRDWVIFILFKLHHLLRTKCKEGVLSLHGYNELSKVESWMKSLIMKPYMTELRKTYNRLQKISPIPPEYMFQDKRFQHLEDLFRNRDKSHDIKEEIIVDKNIHTKPFDLYKKPKRGTYERKLLYKSKYHQVEHCFREEVGNLLPKFDLHVMKLAPPKEDVPPYHINFWQENNCLKHDPCS